MAVAPSDSNSTTAVALSDSNSTTPVTPSDSSNQVLIENYKFTPDSLTIKTGDTVEWTNNDSVIHTVKFDNFESDSLNKGSSYQHIFNSPGTFSYICGPHPYMKGIIIVQ